MSPRLPLVIGLKVLTNWLPNARVWIKTLWAFVSRKLEATHSFLITE